MENNKLQNYGLWVSVIALIGLVLSNYGLYAQLGLTQDGFKSIADALLTVLVGAGIISSPNVGKGFSDKE